MGWVLDHLADLEADFLRFYRVDDFHELDGPKFFRLAWRVSTYGGVMGMRLEAEQPRSTESPAQPPAVRPAAASSSSTKPLAAFAAGHPDVFDTRRAV